MSFFFRFSSARKCSNEGRALMQLDFRQFVMKLERISELKPMPHQDHVVNYVKAYYIPEAELEQWVKIHTVILLSQRSLRFCGIPNVCLLFQEYSPNQLKSLINSVAYSNNKTKQKLNQMVTELSDKIGRRQQ